MLQNNHQQLDAVQLKLLHLVGLQLTQIRMKNQKQIGRYEGTQDEQKIWILDFVQWQLNSRQYLSSQIKTIKSLLQQHILEINPQNLRTMRIYLILQLAQKNEELEYLQTYKLNQYQIELLKAILESETFFEYLNIRQSMLPQTSSKKSIRQLILGCFQYFSSQEFIIINQKATPKSQLLGISLPNRWIMISAFFLLHDASMLLLLLHLHFQIQENSYDMSFSRYNINSQFCSELWHIKFVPELFETSLIQDINSFDFWRKDSIECAKIVLNSQRSYQCYVPVHKAIKYNQTLKFIIQEIRVLLYDIINLKLNDLCMKYFDYRLIKPKLHRYYSSLQYWYCLLVQIRCCVLNKHKIVFIKEYNVRQDNFIVNVLDIMLKTDQSEQYLLLEQLFFLLFAQDCSIEFISNLIRSCITEPVDSLLISSQDLEMISTIMHSDAVSWAAQHLNQIDSFQFNRVDFYRYYDEMTEFLRNTRIIRFQNFTVDSLSLMSGRIALSGIKFYDEVNSIRTRALRIFTILREIFSQRNILQYLSPENILKYKNSTLDNYSNSLWYYLETEIFGSPLLIIHDGQAEFILKLRSWALSKGGFQSIYKLLSQSQQQPAQTHQQQLAQIVQQVLDRFQHRSQLLNSEPLQQVQKRRSTRCFARK